MPSRIHYQPLTGPVWREPVASRMAWLPQGQPRALEVPPTRLGGAVVPFVAAVAVATSLAWVPWGVPRAQAAPPPRPSVFAFDPQPRVPFVPIGTASVPRIARTADAWIVVVPFQQAAAPFDPALSPVVTMHRLLPAERRWPSEMVQPLLTDVAVGVDAIIGDLIRPARRLDSWQVVQPLFFTPPPAFDPTQFPLVLLVKVPRPDWRPPSEFVEPFTSALYRPEGLQWLPSGRDVPRIAPRPVQTWSLLHPAPIAAPFDPAKFPWAPVYLYVPSERRWPGLAVAPITAALYRPERLEWIPRGTQPWPGHRPRTVAWTVVHPMPLEGTALGGEPLHAPIGGPSGVSISGSQGVVITGSDGVTISGQFGVLLTGQTLEAD